MINGGVLRNLVRDNLKYETLVRDSISWIPVL
jgi:hypothetical protein